MKVTYLRMSFSPAIEFVASSLTGQVS
jgi:hypothetical protein